MAGGFAKDGAVQEQIDASIEDAIQRARSRLPRGESQSPETGSVLKGWIYIQ